jgi:hypothetical protein
MRLSTWSLADYDLSPLQRLRSSVDFSCPPVLGPLHKAIEGNFNSRELQNLNTLGAQGAEVVLKSSVGVWSTFLRNMSGKCEQDPHLPIKDPTLRTQLAIGTRLWAISLWCRINRICL